VLIPWSEELGAKYRRDGAEGEEDEADNGYEAHAFAVCQIDSAVVRCVDVEGLSQYPQLLAMKVETMKY
jgi:hypothetical protein